MVSFIPKRSKTNWKVTVYIRVEDVVLAMNQCARIFYAKPSDKMTMYGITGTNGKSTCANIIKYIRELKEPCGISERLRLNMERYA